MIDEILSLGLKVAIITDDIVAKLYGESLQKQLDAHLFVFPHGEAHKTRETKLNLEDQMLQAKLGRDTCLVGLGGGVVTDMAGYIAATYMRGISLVLIPTTLMGMADAAIGGKNGVNTPHGKNLIGTFYQPRMTFINSSFLKTLPQKEMKQGFAEMIKHGLIADASYFALLESDHYDLDQVIKISGEIKHSIVAEDEKDHGKRHLLNFGHTVAHAIEKATDYSISHGEAVAMGLVAESRISNELGHLNTDSFNRIISLLKKHQLPTELPSASFIKYMEFDKKAVQGKPLISLLSHIGSPLSYKYPLDSSCLLCLQQS